MKPVTAIIETPKGSTAKYDYDEKGKYFKLSKVLPAGMAFPFDFGFIPGTKGGDGDPLDVIVISEFKTFTGCAMECRIIGAMKAVAEKKNGKEIRNDRFLGIPEVSELFKNITSAEQLPKSFLVQLEAFFKNYNREEGKEFSVRKILHAGKANGLLKKQPHQ